MTEPPKKESFTSGWRCRTAETIPFFKETGFQGGYFSDVAIVSDVSYNQLKGSNPDAPCILYVIIHYT